MTFYSVLLLQSVFHMSYCQLEPLANCFDGIFVEKCNDAKDPNVDEGPR